MKKLISATILAIGLCGSTFVTAAATPISNANSFYARMVAFDPPIPPSLDPPIPPSLDPPIPPIGPDQQA